jgi:hypothetical protein
MRNSTLSNRETTSTFLRLRITALMKKVFIHPQGAITPFSTVLLIPERAREK